MFQNPKNRSLREGDDRPAPTSTLPRVWDMLVNHFFRLLWANVLCVLCCIPIVTIPASICGLFAVVQQYYRKGYGDVGGAFFREFKQDFWIRLSMTVALVCLPFAGWWFGSLFAVWAAYAVCALFAVLALLTAAWLFPQLALLKLKPLQALWNAVILTGLETTRNLGLLFVEVLFFGVLIAFWPLSFLLLLFLIPVAPVIAINAMTESVIEEKIIGKAEEATEA